MTMINKIKMWFTSTPSDFTLNNPFQSFTQSQNVAVEMVYPMMPIHHPPSVGLFEQERKHGIVHNKYVHLDDEYEVDLPNLNQATEFSTVILEKTLSAHQACLDSLESALRGKNPKVYQEYVMNNDRCCLGNWLYDNQKVFSSYAEYTLLLDAHQTFHDCVHEILSYHREGQFIDAILLFKKDLLSLSKQTKEALIDLYREVQKNNHE